MVGWRTNIIRGWRWIRCGLLVAVITWGGLSSPVIAADVPAVAREQTDVDQAEHSFDASGVPLLKIKGVGEVRHPAWVAIYALEYIGVEQYGAGVKVAQDPGKGRACVRWLAENLKQDARGNWVWTYPFDSTYNDVTVRAPWSSAFAQAVGIQALVESANRGGDVHDVELAKKAAEVLLKPMGAGGLMFERGEDAWFEEIASPANNPPHILNGHMRALLALRALSEATGDTRFQKAYARGVATLERWLPLFDAGYWLRYDLNPRKDELLFRINNPYGNALPTVPIDRVSLVDPQTRQEKSLDVGETIDAGGAMRIAGNDWGQPSEVDGRSIRRLQPVRPESSAREGELPRPGTFFYLKLPAAWQDNLRSQPLELVVRYKDEAVGNACVEMRSIAPGSAFRGLRDGDLLLTGSGQWRDWRIFLRPEDLGYWVGMSYGRKHAEYLEALAGDEPGLRPWAMLARGYVNLAAPIDQPRIVQRQPIPLPTQTPLMPKYDLDDQGVLQQFSAGPETRFTPSGVYDGTSPLGPRIYSPYLAAVQILSGIDVAGGAFTTFDRTTIRREPALKWLLSDASHRRVGNADVFQYNFPNVYNDVETKPPWQSAFGQAFVLKALLYAQEHLGAGPEVTAAMRRAAEAYRMSVSEGGVTTFANGGQPFFEEVPNAVHILNAHIASLNVLHGVAAKLKDAQMQSLVDAGVASYRERAHLFNTGYWLRYDANPQKEFLLQIDWNEGESSPLIESIDLLNPQTATATHASVGTKDAFETYPHISGIDWMDVESADGRSGRRFENGYKVRAAATPSAARHNVFVQCVLPERSFSDTWAVPPHLLAIRYKDLAKGLFTIKAQAINEGNRLVFLPIRGSAGSHLECTGNGQWKTAYFEIAPEELGWYVGTDYQKFHVEQLEELARQTGDWFVAQSAVQQRAYLDAHGARRPVILQSAPPAFLEDITARAKVVSSSTMYPEHGVENALDGNPNNNYVAAVEGPLPQQFELEFNSVVDLRELMLVWESAENYATSYDIEAIEPGEGGEKVRLLAKVEDGKGQAQQQEWSTGENVRRLRVTVRATHGQPRLLLRQIKLLAIPESAHTQGAVDAKSATK